MQEQIDTLLSLENLILRASWDEIGRKGTSLREEEGVKNRKKGNSGGRYSVVSSVRLGSNGNKSIGTWKKKLKDREDIRKGGNR